MVGYYFEQGPRKGVPKLFKVKLDPKKHGTSIGHNGIGADTEEILMKNEGLELVPEPSSKKFKAWELAILLKEYGPIMFSWKKPRENGNGYYGHYCVMVGVNVEDEDILYHDPEDGKDQTMGLWGFNERLYWGLNSMMRRKGQKHAPRVKLTVR